MENKKQYLPLQKKMNIKEPQRKIGIERDKKQHDKGRSNDKSK